jgi:hypothetical protein
VDFLHTARVFIDGDGERIATADPAPDVVGPEDFFNGSPVKHLMCWRRERGLSIGGIDESMRGDGPDDWDFPWRMAEDGAVFKTVAEPLYVFRDHRECERLTTHIPLNQQKRVIRRVMRKHGVPRSDIERHLAEAEGAGGYLRQALYRSRVDRWIKTLRGYDPRKGGREQYEHRRGLKTSD